MLQNKRHFSINRAYDKFPAVIFWLRPVSLMGNVFWQMQFSMFWFWYDFKLKRKLYFSRVYSREQTKTTEVIYQCCPGARKNHDTSYCEHGTVFKIDFSLAHNLRYRLFMSNFRLTSPFSKDLSYFKYLFTFSASYAKIFRMHFLFHTTYLCFFCATTFDVPLQKYYKIDWRAFYKFIKDFLASQLKNMSEKFRSGKLTSKIES